jgi:hypothetical protein
MCRGRCVSIFLTRSYVTLRLQVLVIDFMRCSALFLRTIVGGHIVEDFTLGSPQVSRS